MSAHVYEKTEVVGSSKIGFEDAVNNALSFVKESGKKIRWFEVVETRGYVEDDGVAYWQVTVKVGSSENQ